MNFKNVLMGGLILGASVMSSTQLFAASNMGEQYDMNIVYSVESSTTVSSLESQYKPLFFQLLQEYANVDTTKLPAEATFKVTVTDRKTLNKFADSELERGEADYKQKLISEEQFKKIQLYVATEKQKTYDQITCSLSLSDSEDSQIDPEYSAIFNSETKELELLHLADSDEYLKILADETPATISVNNYKTKYADFIKKFTIGGIQNPVCITDQVKNTNQQGGLSVLIYRDKDDASKKVTIGLDGANGNLNYIFVWPENYYM